MRRGRKPTPTRLKKLRGNPGKRRLPKNEPQPPALDDHLTPPKFLDEIGRKEWVRVASTLHQLGLLTNVDRAALSGYCRAFSRWVQAEQYLDDNGLTLETSSGYEQQRPEVSIALRYLQQMHSFAAEFGFTPASRSRVEGQEKDPEDEYEQHLQRRPAAAAADKDEHAPSRSVH